MQDGAGLSRTTGLIALKIVGVIPIATGVIGWCPAYSGISVQYEVTGYAVFRL